jgi:hypothetical protein
MFLNFLLFEQFLPTKSFSKKELDLEAYSKRYNLGGK